MTAPETADRDAVNRALCRVLALSNPSRPATGAMDRMAEIYEIAREAHLARPPSTEDDGGDRRCDECPALNPVWFTHSPLWNRVKGGFRAAGDPGGVLCPNCFMAQADHALGEHVWAVLPVNDAASNPTLDALRDARAYIGNPIRSGLPRHRQRDTVIDKIDAAILAETTTASSPGTPEGVNQKKGDWA